MGVSKTTSRKAVSKAIAKQDIEQKRTQEQIQEAIRLKAYELFLERGCQNGNDIQDWQEAEQIVLGKTNF